MKIGLTVNGLHVEAHYPDDEIENVHKPLLRQLAKRHFASASRRTIVFLSAPPGTGKSTLTAFLGIPLSSDGGDAADPDVADGWISSLQRLAGSA